MNKYYFRLYQCNDEDGNTVWIEADSWEEAESEIQSEYHHINHIDRLYMK